MKKIITSISLSISFFGYSQIVIGGANGTAPSNKKSAVLLEFEAGQNKGIILPYVRTMPSAADVIPGTILLDASVNNSAQSKVKYYAPSNINADVNGWVDLSAGNEANISNLMVAQPLSTGGANAVTEEPGAKTIIGSDTSSANGVLVLESTTKVMILPQVTSTSDIKDPAPGMMVYLNGTNKRLAVYNGSKWTYWAP